VRELADLGYTDAWTAETSGFDAFTPLALAVTWAPRIRVGTAIVPVYIRGPGLPAMSAAAKADIAPGRFVMGVGASSPVIVRDRNAGEYANPYARVRAPRTSSGAPWPGRRSPRRTRDPPSNGSPWNSRPGRFRRS